MSGDGTIASRVAAGGSAHAPSRYVWKNAVQSEATSCTDGTANSPAPSACATRHTGSRSTTTTWSQARAPAARARPSCLT